MGLTPSPGRFHETQGNCALEPQLLKHMCPEPVLTARGAQQREAHQLQLGSTRSQWLETARAQQGRLSPDSRNTANKNKIQ